MWVLLALLVIAGSLGPPESQPMRALDSLDISDKIEHFAAYAMLALLPAIHERRAVVIRSAIAALFLGILLEYLQRLTGWRDFELADMAANTVGICFGIALGASVRSAAIPRLS